MFQTEQQDECFIIADYSMIEIVILAVISQDPTMLDNIYKKKDMHIFIASLFIDKPYEQLMALKISNPKELKNQRTPMKSVNFGVSYGMGASSKQKIGGAEPLTNHQPFKSEFLYFL